MTLITIFTGIITAINAAFPAFPYVFAALLMHHTAVIVAMVWMIRNRTIA